MSFQNVIVSLANKTNCLYKFDPSNENVAYLIERDKRNMPSEKVWRKTFSYADGNVTIKVHGKTLAVKPLAALA